MGQKDPSPTVSKVWEFLSNCGGLGKSEVYSQGMWAKSLNVSGTVYVSIPKNPDPSRKIVGLMVEKSHPQVIGL